MDRVRADLHNHLRTGSKVSGLLNRVVDSARINLGPGGIVGVIDFDNFGTDSRYFQLLCDSGYERRDLGNAMHFPEQDILLVKGQEVQTHEGHLLVLGLKKYKHLVPGRTLSDTIKEARDNDGIVIADHPFYFAGLGSYLEQDQRLLEQLDAIEVHNGEASFGLPFGPIPSGANEKAQEFYSRIKPHFPNLGAISSSDGHSLYELGRSYTMLEMPPHKELKKPEDVSGALRTAVQKATFHDCFSRGGRIGALNHILYSFLFKIAPRIAERFV